MSNAEEVIFDDDWVLTRKLPALLWLWRDFWNWELFGRGEHQSGQTKRCRLACKTFYLIKHDRELRGEA